MTRKKQATIGKLVTKYGFTKEEAAHIINQVSILKNEMPTVQIAKELNIDENVVLILMGK